MRKDHTVACTHFCSKRPSRPFRERVLQFRQRSHCLKGQRACFLESFLKARAYVAAELKQTPETRSPSMALKFMKKSTKEQFETFAKSIPIYYMTMSMSNIVYMPCGVLCCESVKGPTDFDGFRVGAIAKLRVLPRTRSMLCSNSKRRRPVCHLDCYRP